MNRIDAGQGSRTRDIIGRHALIQVKYIAQKGAKLNLQGRWDGRSWTEQRDSRSGKGLKGWGWLKRTLSAAAISGLRAAKAFVKASKPATTSSTVKNCSASAARPTTHPTPRTAHAHLLFRVNREHVAQLVRKRKRRREADVHANCIIRKENFADVLADGLVDGRPRGPAAKKAPFRYLGAGASCTASALRRRIRVRRSQGGDSHKRNDLRPLQRCFSRYFAAATCSRRCRPASPPARWSSRLLTRNRKAVV